MHNKFTLGKDNNKIKLKGDVMFKRNMGLMLGAVGGMDMIGVAGVILLNTKAMRRHRMMKRALKTVRNVGCVMQKLSSF